jgi:ribosomal protein S18 acetylase RimI-like enzyme
MMLLKEINTYHRYYSFVEDLLHAAFPADERREDELQREYTDSHDYFHCLLILKSGNPVGLLTYWHFDTFVYIEHFAISEELRRGGLGKQAITLFVNDISLPVILEVEMPRIKGDITHRRIAFYRRAGFTLRKMAYKQPPYRMGDEWLPMKLMTYGNFQWLKMAEAMRDTIYQEVYGIQLSNFHSPVKKYTYLAT